jgi:hypothetical protein
VVGQTVSHYGIVVYEMLAGRRPFEGKDDLAVLTSIANDTPKPIAAVRADVPSGLVPVLARALECTHAARYASATELLNDLAACRTAMTGSASRRVDVWRLLLRPIVAIPAVIVLVAASVAGTMAYRRASRARWARVEGDLPLAPWIIPLSNFASKGPSAVESFRSLGPYGTYDMAGNVREWVWNESAGGRRWIVGGAWNDPPHLFVAPNSQPPFERLGTPADRKRHVVTNSGHAAFPRSELIREVLGWLDRHLGPIQSSNP